MLATSGTLYLYLLPGIEAVHTRQCLWYNYAHWLTSVIIIAVRLVCRGGSYVAFERPSVRLSHRSTAALAASGFAAEFPVGRRSVDSCRCRRSAVNTGNVRWQPMDTDLLMLTSWCGTGSERPHRCCLGPLTRVDDLPGRRTLRSTNANRLVVPPSNCQQSAAEPLRLRLHSSAIHCQLTSLWQARCPPSVDC